MDEPFIIALDDDMSRLACLVSLVGALCVHSLGWQAIGWTLIILGMLTLWLAHQVAIAPLCQDPRC